MGKKKDNAAEAVAGTVPDTGDDTPVRDPADTAGGPVVWTLAEAVRRTGVARSTMQRRLKEGVVHGAERTPDGGWAIPVAGLIAAGIDPLPDTPDEPPADPALEAADLRAQLIAAEHQAEMERAMRVAAERELARVEDALADSRKRADEMASVVRMLTAGTAADTAAGAPTGTPVGRRRLWGRRSG